MDGHFVPELTFGPKMVADLRRVTRLPLDVHLMIERPEAWIEPFAGAGATYLTVHVESTADVAGTLRAIRACGVRPGITLSPETPLEAVLPHLAAVDVAQVMSVRPGRGGQTFIAAALDRIRRVRAALDAAGLAAELEVDGGVNVQNARDAARAGATVLVAGTAVYGDPGGVAAGIAALRAAAR